jgi:hypothetical protein
MPTLCPHCHKLVAEQLRCPNCGKKMAVAADPERIDRRAMLLLAREALLWVLGIAGIGILCAGALYILLS